MSRVRSCFGYSSDASSHTFRPRRVMRADDTGLKVNVEELSPAEIDPPKG